MGLRRIVFDVGHGGALPAPGVVDEQLRVDAEGLVQHALVGVGHLAHGLYAQPLQPPDRALAYAPEVRHGPVIPQRLPVAVFAEDADEVACVLGDDVQSHLGQIQIAADAAGGGDAQGVFDICHDGHGKLPCVHLPGGEIIRYVHEHLVYGVYMDILRRRVLQVDAVDPGGIVDIQGHPGRGGDVFDALGDLEHPAAVFDAQGLQRRRHRKADGLFRPAGVCHHKLCLHGVQPPLHTLHRGVEGLQVYAQICPLPHHSIYLHCFSA